MDGTAQNGEPGRDIPDEIAAPETSETGYQFDITYQPRGLQETVCAAFLLHTKPAQKSETPAQTAKKPSSTPHFISNKTPGIIPPRHMNDDPNTARPLEIQLQPRRRDPLTPEEERRAEAAIIQMLADGDSYERDLKQTFEEMLLRAKVREFLLSRLLAQIAPPGF